MPESNIKEATYPLWETDGERTTRPELIAMMMKRMFESPPITKKQITEEYEKLQPK